MSSKQTDVTEISVEIANQFVNLANSRLQEGVPAGLLAGAMRHAAANFSAFAMSHGEGPAEETPVEEFGRMYAYYAEIHRNHNHNRKQGGGLDNLIAKAKEESGIE